MIKPKTKKQKDQDQQSVEKAAHKCGEVLNDFIRELYECELEVSWLRIGLINDMSSAASSFKYSKERAREGYTFTDYEEDRNHKQWNNATHIRHYE